MGNPWAWARMGDFSIIPEEQPAKRHKMFFKLFVFRFEISGNDFNEDQPAKINPLSVTLFVFQLEMSGINDNDEQ